MALRSPYGPRCRVIGAQKTPFFWKNGPFCALQNDIKIIKWTPLILFSMKDSVY